MSVLRTAAIAAVAVVVALVVVETGGRVLAERAAVDELSAQGIDGAQVTVGRAWWRPTMVPAMVGHGLDRVRVELRDAEVSGVRIERADYVLDDLSVDPALGGALGVRAVGNGTFRLVVAPSAVAEAVGVQADVEEGRIVIGPDREPAKVRLDGTDLLIESAYLQREQLEHRVPAVDGRLLPCDPEVALVGDLLELRCTGDRLPRILDAPLGEPVADLPAPPELQPPQTLDRNGGG